MYKNKNCLKKRCEKKIRIKDFISSAWPAITRASEVYLVYIYTLIMPSR